MKTVLATRSIEIPEGVEVEVKARTVTVTGPRGKLFRDFKHIAMDLMKTGGGTDDEGNKLPEFIRVDLWFANRVTRGFLYKMRFVYSHFPINVTLTGNVVEIRNFLGEKRVRKVALCEGVEYVRTSNVKDQIELSGNDITMVSLTAAKIQQATNIRHKDLRKFLDGIYVSEKGPIPEEE